MPSRLEIDTGGDGTLVIYPRFVKRNRLSRSLTGGLKSEGRGAGGEQQRITRRIKGAKLGSFIIEQPVASFAQDEDGVAGDGFDGILGGEILRRFKVVFDYSRRRMMLEPNSSFYEPYEVGMSGIGFEYDKSNCNLYRIESIEPNSPASEAGLQPGDIVTAIDARPLEDVSSNEFEQIFKQHGKQLTLTIKRGEELIQKRITLRRSI
jgi:membrane-associated protease RseP (regulator of RpoE activity)